MSRVRLLRRHPRFVLAIWLWTGAGLAVAVALASLFPAAPGWPPGLHSAVQPAAAAATVWRLPWSAAAVTPGGAAASAADALLGGLVGLAALAILMAAVNSIALLASRRARERRERAIRQSLGADRRVLARERSRAGRFLMAGGFTVGVAGGLLAMAYLRASWPAGLLPQATPLLPPAAVLGAFLLAGLLPRRGGRPGIDTRLLGGHAVSGERGVSRPRARIAGIQFGLAVTVMATAGALYRAGNDRAAAAAPAPGLLGVALRLPGDTPVVARAQLYAALLERLAASMPAGRETIASPGAWLGNGVRDVVLAECGNCVLGGMVLPLRPAFATHHMVSYGFTEALGMTLVEGRTFTPGDGPGARRVAVVNEAFARSGFERGRALGRRVQVGGLRGEWHTVVGVVRDRVVRGLGAPRGDTPALYLPVLQEPPFAVTVGLRTDEDPDLAATRIRAAIRSLGVRGATGPATTAAAEAASNASALLWFGDLYLALAALALLLAIAGVNGLVRDATRARQRELAIRAALGGRYRHLASAVIGDAARVIALGSGLGLVGAFATGRTVQMRVPAVRALEPGAFLLIAAGLAVFAVGAALLETRRIARTPTARLLPVD